MNETRIPAESVYPTTERTRLRRRPARGTYDRAVVHAILDEALVCHLALSDQGQPRVLPTAFVRDGETIYVHGAAANRTLSALAEGAPVSVAVTLLDGLVLARSAFHHSMNYRSVVIYGEAREVREPGEKRRALSLLVDKISPARSSRVRPPSDDELRATSLLALPLVEVSAKVRAGGPVDDAADMTLDVWAGEIPLAVGASPGISDSGREGAYERPALPATLRTLNATNRPQQSG